MIENKFKKQLRKDQSLVGIWLGLANSYTTEIIASTTKFDWFLIDAEHGPNTVQTTLSQLQVLKGYAACPIVRPPVGDTALIKQYLDIGAQTLLIPMVETAEHADQLVKSMRYPPEGCRGVGSALARASLWNTIDGYLDHCNDEMCLLLQVESRLGLDNLEAIASVEGVDGIFIGPADLSASLGYRGRANDSYIQETIAQALSVIKGLGKSAGILSANTQQAQIYIEMGFDFVAVGVDTSLLVKATNELALLFDKQKSKKNIESDVY